MQRLPHYTCTFDDGTGDFCTLTLEDVREVFMVRPEFEDRSFRCYGVNQPQFSLYA